MKELIEYDLEDGSTIIIEGEPQNDETVYRGGDRGVSTVKKAARTFSQALEKVTPVADTIADKLTKQKHKPDEVTVEFGLKLGGETDLVIAAASVEAHFKVSIKWKNTDKK